MKVRTFNEFLQAVIGITWNEYDECYSGSSKTEIDDGYEYYTENPEKYAEYFRD